MAACDVSTDTVFRHCVCRVGLRHMVHLDVKKVGRIPDGGGWRVHGRDSAEHRAANRAKTAGARAGYVYLHSAVDGFSRLAYTEPLDDETAQTTIGFFSRARAFFAAHGIRRIVRIVTDNIVIQFVPNEQRRDLTIERRTGGNTRPDAPPYAALNGEWGLSMHAESRRGGEMRNVLIDFGYTSETLTNNMSILKIDPSLFDAIVLSHGHYDHFGGMVGGNGREHRRIHGRSLFAHGFGRINSGAAGGAASSGHGCRRCGYGPASTRWCRAPEYPACP